MFLFNFSVFSLNFSMFSWFKLGFQILKLTFSVSNKNLLQWKIKKLKTKNKTAKLYSSNSLKNLNFNLDLSKEKKRNLFNKIKNTVCKFNWPNKRKSKRIKKTHRSTLDKFTNQQVKGRSLNSPCSTVRKYLIASHSLAKKYSQIV